MTESAIRILQSALGLPSWEVRCIAQVGLDMKFGAPRLEVHDSRANAATTSHSSASISRRRVHLLGTHYLCVTEGCWRLEWADGTVVRDTSSALRVNRAVARLRGEKLEAFCMNTRTGASVLHFDLGARITIRAQSADADDLELWSVKTSSHIVQIFNGGLYSAGTLGRSREVQHALGNDETESVVVARTAKLARMLR